MNYANKLITMANDELDNHDRATAKGMKNAATLAIGRSAGLINAVEALGIIPVYNSETKRYNLV